jgi:hypothetical protein
MTDAHETFPVDSVICTIPLGCLHRKDLKFTPPLPDTVQTAISNLGFGVLEKLYIRFPEIWWLQPHEVGEEYALEFTRFPTELIESPVLPKGSFVLVSLAKTHYPAPIFQVFVSTTLAKYLVRLPRATLRTMFQEYIIPHLPYYDPANPACQISEVDLSEWSQDPLAGFGSYTHVPVGSDSGDGNMAVLAGRILEAEDGRGGVWFAGEHTAETEVIDGVKYTTMATVTGAYKSGTRAGNLILQYYEGS